VFIVYWVLSLSLSEFRLMIGRCISLEYGSIPADIVSTQCV
jgi:hypothetical protein